MHFGSRYVAEGCQKGDKIWQLDRGALLYITTQIGEFWPRLRHTITHWNTSCICPTFLSLRLSKKGYIKQWNKHL